MKRIAFCLLFLIFSFCMGLPQTNLKEIVKVQSQIAGDLKQAVEGFGQKISGEEIIYHSTRQDCQNALLVRATDGKMKISWSTPVIKPDASVGEIQLFLIVGMSLQGYPIQGVDPGFQVLINDKPYFHFRNSMGETWTAEGPGNSRMVFQTVIRDQANDGFGYARIILPASAVVSGEPVKVTILGDASGTRHWFMVFQCPDALAWFIRKTSVDTWFDVELARNQGKWNGRFIVPETWAGQNVWITGDKGKMQKVLIPGKDAGKTAGFSLPGTVGSISIEAPEGLSIHNIQLEKPLSKSLVETDRLVSYQLSETGPQKWLLQCQSAASSISGDLRKISESEIARGRILIMASSHQDIAWMDSPQACVENRDKLLITPALKILEEDPRYYNDMEDILMLREYLDRHPDKKQVIYNLTREGRLTWGASYIQPYEEMYFGEPLVRQFYLGRKWFRKEFPGCDARIYWNVDVPGRTLQMPQILAKSGVDYMIISRQDQGMFNWKSPDGSKVLTYSPGHYYNSYVNLKKGFFESVTHFSDLAGFWQKYYSKTTAKPVMPVLSDADMAVPDSYFNYIDTWNSMRDSTHKLPDLVHSTAERFMDEAVATGVDFPEIEGERPEVWLYIHGPSHFEALKAGRSAGRMLPAAEKLASFRSMVLGDWNLYPAERLTKAWESAIYPDHGWGGKNGEITDQTFLDKFREADLVARSVINEATRDIAGEIAFKKPDIPLVLFNSLAWVRTDPVDITLELPDRALKAISLLDGDSKPVSFQVTGPVERYPSGYVKSIGITFIAENIPSLGYRTYYAGSAKKTMEPAAVPSKVPGVIETANYRVVFGKGGMTSLFDKDLQKEIWKTDQFQGGDLFSMHSFGNGAGEFADVQQPDMEEFERSGIGQDWEIVESGPVRIVVTGTGVMNHNQSRITWIFYRNLKRIDVRVDLTNWDGTAYREFRLAFPARMLNPEIAYEVPFGVVRVGKDELVRPAGERYTTPCKDVHPRGINNWISANDGQFGLTISSGVAVWDYVNMTDLPTEATLLQPILLASRQSCHGEGPLYHQKGSHSMEFSLFTHQSGWENGYHQALQANEKLIPVFNPATKGSILPDHLSFLSVDEPNSMVSTVKKSEEDNGLIIRIYDQEGQDKDVKINIFRNPLSAERTNLIEENGKPVSVSGNGLKLKLGHHAIETLKLRF
jgi:alpha-mannosidase